MLALPVLVTEKAKAGYSLNSVRIPGGYPVFTDNVTNIYANLSGPLPSADQIVLNVTLHPGHMTTPAQSVATCGFNCTTAQFSLTIGQLDEGRYNYTVQIGAWQSPQRTFDIVNYYHYLFVDYLGVAQNSIQQAGKDGVDVADAFAQYNLASGYAQHSDWLRAYQALIKVQPMVNADYAARNADYWKGILIIFGSIAVFSVSILAWAIYVARRNKRLKQAGR